MFQLSCLNQKVQPKKKKKERKITAFSAGLHQQIQNLSILILPDCYSEAHLNIAGIWPLWREVHGHIPFNPPKHKKEKQTEGEGGMVGGVINLPNTDVGPKEGHELRHVSGHTCKCKKKLKKKN